MNRAGSIALLAALSFAAPVLAADDIFRCVGAGGAISYQQMPCEAAGGVARVPTEFPPANSAERERIFQREADMYRRLEAQRDRQLAETIARNAREEQAAALERERLAAAAQAPTYAVAYPYWRPRAVHRVPGGPLPR